MIRGVDLQQSVVQTPLTEKVQQVQQQQPDMQQRYFSLQLQVEKKRLQEKVNDADEAQRLAVRDQPQKRREGADAERKGERDGSQENSENDPDQGLHIDIKA